MSTEKLMKDKRFLGFLGIMTFALALLGGGTFLASEKAEAAAAPTSIEAPAMAPDLLAKVNPPAPVVAKEVTEEKAATPETPKVESDCTVVTSEQDHVSWERIKLQAAALGCKAKNLFTGDD